MRINLIKVWIKGMAVITITALLMVFIHPVVGYFIGLLIFTLIMTDEIKNAK